MRRGSEERQRAQSAVDTVEGHSSCRSEGGIGAEGESRVEKGQAGEVGGRSLKGSRFCLGPNLQLPRVAPTYMDMSRMSQRKWIAYTIYIKKTSVEKEGCSTFSSRSGRDISVLSLMDRYPSRRVSSFDGGERRVLSYIGWRIGMQITGDKLKN